MSLVMCLSRGTQIMGSAATAYPALRSCPSGSSKKRSGFSSLFCFHIVFAS
ncbi:unnamed protein product, partial [Amoebophrya sp. A120]|eukprot:GSA120T00005945001.1